MGRRDDRTRSAAPSIEFRHFRYFLAVYEELHFGRAAGRLHIAQPPLSQAVQKLEAQLGVQLLQRTSRVVTPTTAGHAFAAEARKVLAAVDLAIAEARRTPGDVSLLRVGCSPYLSMESLLQFLGALDVRLPALRTEVTHAPAPQQIARLRAEELDVGIIPDVGEHEQIHVEPVFRGQALAAFVPAQHKLASKERVTPGDLKGETLVIAPRATNPALHDRLLALLDEAGYRFRDVHEAGGLSAREFLLGVLRGVGVAVSSFSPREIGEAGASVVRIPLDPPVPGPDLVLAWRVDPPAQVGSAIEAAREVARELRRRAE